MASGARERHTHTHSISHPPCLLNTFFNLRFNSLTLQIRSKMETPPAEELLKKILELEESQEHLKQEMSRLKVSTEVRQRSHSVSPHRPARRNIGDGAQLRRKSGAASFRNASPLRKESRFQGSMNLRGGGASAGEFTDKQYLNILQSMAQTVHAYDLNMRIIFWYVVPSFEISRLDARWWI